MGRGRCTCTKCNAARSVHGRVLFGETHCERRRRGCDE